ncbi:MAG: hypothetical protein AAF937_02560 [Planctomycetota bacterium]
MNQQRAGTLLALSIAALGPQLAGCTGVEPAAIGVGLSTAKAGIAFFDGDDVRSFELVRYEDAVAAADEAARVLGMELRYTRRPGEQWEIRNYDLRGRAVLFVELKGETPTVTMVRTEARTPQQRGIAGLLTKQIFVELQRADAYLEDWAKETGDSRLLNE